MDAALLDKEEHIRVVCRARPLLTHERRARESASVSSPDGRTVEVLLPARQMVTYPSNRFLDPASTQEQAFEDSGVRRLLRSTLQGFAATVFAYGQTGAGKTHTMLGDLPPVGASRVRRPGEGLVPRSVRYLFAQAASLAAARCTLRASCLEIYNDSVSDLLSSTRGDAALRVRYSTAHGFFANGLTIVTCRDESHMLTVLATAARNRRIGSHSLNARSNRSHTIFTVYIDVAGPAQSTFGKISFVDLAGSERLKDSHSEGVMVRETGHINRSLYTLGKVIAAMTSRRRQQFVPYRDSALTKLLIDSLGGRCLTLMIACVSSAGSHANETARTLQFAMGVKNVRTRPAALLDPHQKLVHELRAQVAALREENERLRGMTMPGMAATAAPPAPMASSSAWSDSEDGGSASTARTLPARRSPRGPPVARRRRRSTGVRAKPKRRVTKKKQKGRKKVARGAGATALPPLPAAGADSPPPAYASVVAEAEAHLAARPQPSLPTPAIFAHLEREMGDIEKRHAAAPPPEAGAVEAEQQQQEQHEADADAAAAMLAPAERELERKLWMLTGSLDVEDLSAPAASRAAGGLGSLPLYGSPAPAAGPPLGLYGSPAAPAPAPAPALPPVEDSPRPAEDDQVAATLALQREQLQQQAWQLQQQQRQYAAAQELWQHQQRQIDDQQRQLAALAGTLASPGMAAAPGMAASPQRRRRRQRRQQQPSAARILESHQQRNSGGMVF